MSVATERSALSSVPMLDLKAQYSAIKEEILEAVHEVLENQQFILGPAVAELERNIAAYCGCRHAIGVSSGTDALLISLMAEGIGPGDEVITTPYTFFATAGSVARLGATPVFVDICPDTYNINPSAIEAQITSRTRAIMPVHLFGQCADMDPILDVAGRHNLAVIEDAAKAIGAEYCGRRAGSMGHYGCFSFFPSKNLGGAGDGGMVVTNDPVRADTLRLLRVHGAKPKYHHQMLGGNFRLDTMQAAIVNVKLRYLDQWTAARQAHAKRYRELFEQNGAVATGAVRLPYEMRESRHIYNQFVIRVEPRDDLQTHLRQCGVGSEVYYPVPAHLQRCFEAFGYREHDFPNSERAAAETVALPVYPELADASLTRIVDAVGDFLAARKSAWLPHPPLVDAGGILNGFPAECSSPTSISANL